MTIWRWSIGVVLVGHVLALAFPASVLLWNRQPVRLFVLEGFGLMAGTIALAGLVATLVGRVRRFPGQGAQSAFDAIAWTLVLIEVTSGVTIAVLYRWASSWSEVTLTPYLLSLLRFEPSVVLIAGMPLLVRLHVFTAFAIVAVLPFTRLVRCAVLPLHVMTQRALAPAVRACGPAWMAIETWSAKHVQRLQAVSIRDEGEENP